MRLREEYCRDSHLESDMPRPAVPSVAPEFSPEQLQRLEDARHILVSCGEPITAKAIAHHAGISTGAALAYCHSIGLSRSARKERQAEQRLQRIRQAIEDLQHENKRVSTRAVARIAGVGGQHVSAYLRNLGHRSTD